MRGSERSATPATATAAEMRIDCAAMTWNPALPGVALGLFALASASAGAAEPQHAVELATGDGRTCGGAHYDEAFSASYKLSVRGLRYLDVDLGASTA